MRREVLLISLLAQLLYLIEPRSFGAAARANIISSITLRFVMLNLFRFADLFAPCFDGVVQETSFNGPSSKYYIM